MEGQNDNPTAVEYLYREARHICSLILKDKSFDLMSAKDELLSLLEIEPPPDLEWDEALNDYSFSENEEEGIHWVASVMARKLRTSNPHLGSRKDENDPTQAPSEFTDLVNRG